MTDDSRARPVFPSAPKPKSVPDDPEALFGELPRSRDAVGALWSHQADQLRTYSEKHRDTSDVALELPTGSGKTLVGLLAGEWRRRALLHRVVYACPTVQLARQVTVAATRQGVPARQLTGTHTRWDQRSVSEYVRGEAIAVTTYSHIFNINSHLADAKTLIFDDAHAAEGIVAEAWALEVPKGTDAFGDLFDALEDDLDPHFVQRMTATMLGGRRGDPEVRLIPLSVVSRRVAEIDAVLRTISGDGSYRFNMLRSNLASCLFYVDRSRWYIRPMIPPTFDHSAFVDPEQRIYLSATLGEAGELERAFGRHPIARVPVPTAWERAGSGRRFFVFPDLAEFNADQDMLEVEPPEEAEQLGFDANDADGQPGLVQRLSWLADKKVILTPDTDSGAELAVEIGVPVDDVFSPSDVAGVESFLDADEGTLVAANRYDGMDLADEACRFMVMSGLPAASHLQDRFLEGKLRAGDVLAERVRTRVIQGVGRCTRGPQDWAVIVVLGEELLRYFSDRDHTGPMPVELQAEVEFGLQASQSSFTNNVALTRSALDRDQDWLDNGEPALAEGRRGASRVQAVNAGDLERSAPREVDAWRAAWRQDWETAARHAVRVIEGLTTAGTRPYRALWSYFASAWYGRAGNAARAAELLRQAHGAASGTTWLREVEPLPAGTAEPDPTDDAAISSVIELLNGPLRRTSAYSTRSNGMLNGLARRASGSYEQGLVQLGELLGARSFKPTGQGRTDAAWLWPDMWLAIEAKSEQTAERMSMDYVRKANTQLRSLAADEGEDDPPSESATVLVAQSRLVDPNAVPIADPNLFTW